MIRKRERDIANRLRLIAGRPERQVQAVAIVDHVPLASILDEVAAVTPRLRARWALRPIARRDLEELDLNARIVTELREADMWPEGFPGGEAVDG